jgi:hypothetical protein
MPCAGCQYPTTHSNEPTIIYKEGHDPHYQRLSEQLKKSNDELTNLLCQTGRARKNKTNIPAAVLKWWDYHCKLDKSRGEPW